MREVRRLRAQVQIRGDREGVKTKISHKKHNLFNLFLAEPAEDTEKGIKLIRTIPYFRMVSLCVL